MKLFGPSCRIPVGTTSTSTGGRLVKLLWPSCRIGAALGGEAAALGVPARLLSEVVDRATEATVSPAASLLSASMSARALARAFSSICTLITVVRMLSSNSFRSTAFC